MHTLLLMATAAFTIAAQDQSVERTTTSPAAAKLSFTVTAVSKDPAPATRYFQVSSSADSDGDGVGDAMLLKVTCGGGRVTHAAVQPRDAASGMATGKRQHKPMTIVKEWDAASPLLGKTAGYDLKANVKARTSSSSASAGWTEVELGRDSQLCV